MTHRGAYKTRMRELLNKLEHRCDAPGFWVIEGWDVVRHERAGYWAMTRDELTITQPDFTAVLSYIAGEKL
jgi:hypothetical protein